MNLFKYAFVTLLASFTATIHAAPAKPAQAATQTATDKNLALFNQNIGIRLVQRSVNTEPQTNKPISRFVIQLENKGKRTIKSVSFLVVFQAGEQALFGQELSINLPKPLKPKATETITLEVPLASLPKQAQESIANLQTPVSAVFGAKQLTFTKGKNIVVK